MSPFDPAGLKEKLTSIEEEMNKPGFWDDPESAQKYMKEKKSIEGKLGELDHLGSQLEDLEVLVEMAEEEPDESLTEEAAGSEQCHRLRSCGSRRNGCSGLGRNAVPHVHQMVREKRV